MSHSRLGQVLLVSSTTHHPTICCLETIACGFPEMVSIPSIPTLQKRDVLFVDEVRHFSGSPPPLSSSFATLLASIGVSEPHPTIKNPLLTGTGQYTPIPNMPSCTYLPCGTGKPASLRVWAGLGRCCRHYLLLPRS